MERVPSVLDQRVDREPRDRLPPRAIRDRAPVDGQRHVVERDPVGQEGALIVSGAAGPHVVEEVHPPERDPRGRAELQPQVEESVFGVDCDVAVDGERRRGAPRSNCAPRRLGLVGGCKFGWHLRDCLGGRLAVELRKVAECTEYAICTITANACGAITAIARAISDIAAAITATTAIAAAITDIAGAITDIAGAITDIAASSAFRLQRVLARRRVGASKLRTPALAVVCRQGRSIGRAPCGDARVALRGGRPPGGLEDSPRGGAQKYE